MPAAHASHERDVVEFIKPLGHAFSMQGSTKLSHVPAAQLVHVDEPGLIAYEFAGQDAQ